MEIGERIRRARTEKDWSQRKLAIEMKVSPSAVAQWEGGDTNPTIEKRAQLTRLLGIPFAELLPEAGKVGELTIRDPQILAIVQILLRLPGPVREGFLVSVAAMAESLEAQRRA